MLPDYQEIFFRYKNLIFLFLLGTIVLGAGIIVSKKSFNFSDTKVEVLDSTLSNSKEENEITVEVSGQVQKPGVYRLAAGARVEDLLVATGGVSANADRIWMDKMLNRAAKLSDGQKVYIPSLDSARDSHSEVLSAKNTAGYQTISANSQARGSGLININTASLSELDSLPGIGQVYGQNIIEHRPYSTVEELLSKGVLKKSVYDKIKDKVSVY